MVGLLVADLVRGVDIIKRGDCESGRRRLGVACRAAESEHATPIALKPSHLPICISCIPRLS